MENGRLAIMAPAALAPPPPPPLCTPSVSQRSEVLAEFWTRLRQKGTQYLFFCVEKMPFLFLFII